MRIPLYQIDAFTSRPFGGNPAAICPLPSWLDDATMQAIAAENNLAETAFFVPESDGFRLRWFTPTVEVELCGHATLAAGHLILTRLEPARASVRFLSRSGPLEVSRDGKRLVLDFPALPIKARHDPALVADAFGTAPRRALGGGPRLAVFARQAQVGPSTPIPPGSRPSPSAASSPQHRASRRCRFRLPLLCAQARHRGGSGHRLGTLRVHALLGEAARQEEALRAPALDARRRALVRDRGERVHLAGQCAALHGGDDHAVTEAAAITIADVRGPADIAAARELFLDYQHGHGFDLAYQGFAEELAGLPGKYAPPAGRLLLARAGEEAAGVVALRPLAAGICEMKRLYVRPAFAAAHSARRSSNASSRKRVRSVTIAMRLDTVAAKMPAAVALYRSTGFVDIPAYYASPIPGTAFMELRLS